MRKKYEEFAGVRKNKIFTRVCGYEKKIIQEFVKCDYMKERLIRNEFLGRLKKHIIDDNGFVEKSFSNQRR